MVKILATIEARMTSKRLPGKVLKKILNKPIIEIIHSRVKKSRLIDEICVATTTNKADDILVKFLKQKKIKYYRGSEFNVIKRVIDACKKFNPKIIVQLTGDNPLLDPNIIDAMLQTFIKKNCDYLTNNAFGKKNRRKYPFGMTINIFYYKCLRNHYKFCNTPDLKEHTSLYFFREGVKKYKSINMKIKKKWYKGFLPRLTIDEIRDFKFVNEIFKYFNKQKKGIHFSYEEVLNFLSKNKSLMKINSSVIQKPFKGL